MTAEGVNAPDRTISGKVTSKVDGSGMSGVNIVLKGTQKGSYYRRSRALFYRDFREQFRARAYDPFVTKL